MTDVQYQTVGNYGHESLENKKNMGEEVFAIIPVVSFIRRSIQCHAMLMRWMRMQATLAQGSACVLSLLGIYPVCTRCCCTKHQQEKGKKSQAVLSRLQEQKSLRNAYKRPLGLAMDVFYFIF
jgi:hypothetical protein